VDPAYLRLWDASRCNVPGEWIEVPSFASYGGATKQVFDFVPDADLEAEAWYVIAHAYPALCGWFAPPCEPGEIVEVARFRTGTARDETAPTFAGATGVFCSYDECGDEGCCGPFAGWWVGVASVPAVDDNGRGVRAYLRRGSATYDFATPSGGGSAAFYASSIGGDPQWALPPGPDPVFVTLRAYDAAGNEDANGVEIDIEAQPGCAGVLPDEWSYVYPTARARIAYDCAGEPAVEPPPDGPADARSEDGGASPGSASSGCGCSIGARP
jgi:hypothetical protein